MAAERLHPLMRLNYLPKRWASFTVFLEEGRVCLSDHARALAKKVPLT
jgi:hypothetical protein